MAETIAIKKGVKVVYIQYPDVALKIESGDTVFDSSKLDKCIGNLRRTTFSDWLKRGENK